MRESTSEAERLEAFEDLSSEPTNMKTVPVHLVVVTWVNVATPTHGQYVSISVKCSESGLPLILRVDFAFCYA